MAARLKPAKYVIHDCTENCWASPTKLGEHHSEVHAMFEAGDGDDAIVLAVRAMGLTTSAGATSRHRKNHLRVWTPEDDEPPDVSEMTDLEILRAIIKQGARHITNWKLGPRETMQALDMYYKLTQGSAMAGMFEAIAAAANREAQPDEQDVPAALSEGERPE